LQPADEARRRRIHVRAARTPGRTLAALVTGRKMSPG
jgi:hypothetical protein